MGGVEVPVARVFVSHADTDAAVAGEIHGWLVADGHEVFLDGDPRDGIAVPFRSAVLPLPWEKPPPWIHTITGSLASRESVGVDTLSARQSSSRFASSVLGAAACGCAQVWPYAVACRTPLHDAGGCGGRQRSAPTGGAA